MSLPETQGSQPAKPCACGLFVFSLAMRSTALPSHMYRDPLAILEAKQSRERREAAKRVRMDRSEAETWSDARKAAEALFDKPEQD